VDLDRQSAIIKNEPGYETIPTELVNNIAGEFKTIEGLSKRMDKLTTEQNITRILAMVVIAGLASVLLRYVWPAPPSTSATTVSPTQSTSPFRQSATTAPPSRRNP
jgi:hypothetical protein